eukprot:TRINITY_DN2529_c0_g1_i2.p3 TRINITY_DN2529_c0_g1~~TRINITY_DN2529_c0_g1_i2.p3  ORF type:complete len:123 (-),score=18.61 TRINITY_DN2529_c0_g1_i2:269-637(-)
MLCDDHKTALPRYHSRVGGRVFLLQRAPAATAFAAPTTCSPHIGICTHARFAGAHGKRDRQAEGGFAKERKAAPGGLVRAAGQGLLGGNLNPLKFGYLATSALGVMCTSTNVAARRTCKLHN